MLSFHKKKTLDQLLNLKHAGMNNVKTHPESSSIKSQNIIVTDLYNWCQNLRNSNLKPKS